MLSLESLNDKKIILSHWFVIFDNELFYFLYHVTHLNRNVVFDGTTLNFFFFFCPQWDVTKGSDFNLTFHLLTGSSNQWSCSAKGMLAFNFSSFQWALYCDLAVTYMNFSITWSFSFCLTGWLVSSRCSLKGLSSQLCC